MWPSSAALIGGGSVLRPRSRLLRASEKIRAGRAAVALAALPAKRAGLLTDMGQGDTSLLPPTSTGRSGPPA